MGAARVRERTACMSQVQKSVLEQAAQKRDQLRGLPRQDRRYAQSIKPAVDMDRYTHAGRASADVPQQRLGPPDGEGRWVT